MRRAKSTKFSELPVTFLAEGVGFIGSILAHCEDTMPCCAQTEIPLWQSVLMAVNLGNWKRGKMAVMHCYTDVGGSPSEITTSPATLVSSPEKWVEFDRRWNETLEDFGFTELHMKNFAHFKGEYEPLRRDEPKRRRFINQLMWVIEDCIEYTAAVSVYSDDYRYVDRYYQLSESMRPYTMGCLGCASRVVVWGKDNAHDKNDMIWIFEKGDQEQGDLRKHWDIAYPDGAVEPIFLRKCDKYLSATPRRIRPFEAADLIGYENLHAHRLKEKMQGEQTFEDLRKPMQRLMNISGAKGWGYFSEAEIISACEQWRIPERPVAV